MPAIDTKRLLRLLPKSKEEQSECVSRLRYEVMLDKIESDIDGISHVRPYIWSVLLNSPPRSADEYIHYVRQGPSPMAQKIQNDVSRTLVVETRFHARVSQASLSRVLNAYVWKRGAIYVQGMNVLASPFLYVCKSESQAFHHLDRLLQRECPQYVLPNIDGVHRGAKLLDKCLETVDYPLYSHLLSKGLTAKLYALPSILTLSACTAPLTEALAIWDFLFAYGTHLNILCVIAQLLLFRDQLLNHSSPMHLLRTFPDLDAEKITGLTIVLITKIPQELYNLLARHPWDPEAGIVIDRLEPFRR
ncbi:two-component GAP Cdc16 [Schizosaccharomyces octosporus yFS286]|uniref:Two-component GAP Cdc16 n=1 Tax=Schizosaccharomyces octosporus (strain yFS286) TaxID=483514 RepID=S9RAV8_SCHOY|nr:two-component GAP Cdc16 [Schizosaccharomyces octosporus yFS286]EPX75275.1 two-component GAP Cdc16 [Schizosaccharomyces octosporus yFS286]